MAEQQTCGMGLAQNSPLPGTLAEVVGAIAANLEAHMAALDLSDDASRNEHEAYQDLAQQHREIEARLKAVAAEMAGYRDLPMGRHDQKAMGGGKLREAFESLVQNERELVALLTDKLDREQRMLAGQPTR
jgi:hypothetical protein